MTLGLLIGSACTHPSQPDGLSQDTVETASSPTETGDSPAPTPCVEEPAPARVVLFGDEAADLTGRYIDIADMDADGCDEALVSESWGWANQLFGYQYPGGFHARVHLLRGVPAGGPIAEGAAVTWLGPEANSEFGGRAVVLLPEAGQMVTGGMFPEPDAWIHAFDVSPALPKDVGYEDRIGYLFESHPDSRGWGVGTDATRCASASGPALCVGAFDVTDGDDYSGQALVFDAPISGPTPVESARARYHGDSGDRAEIVDGESDLDGDGVLDLVVGAYNVPSAPGIYGTGSVAVVLGLPEGVHRLWDVASATFVGAVPQAEFGLNIETGDLDGDGTAEVVVGGPLTGQDGAYVFRGPFDGVRSADDADWTVTGDPSAFTWLGYSAVVGDVDGDGAPDLAVGAPRSVYSGETPGEVAVYLAPVSGEYADAAADRILRSGAGAPDAFGMAMDAGDLDGDGRSDLVVGAPRDPTVGQWAGSVTIVFGSWF